MEEWTLQIRSMTDRHTCSKSYNNPQATSTFLAKKYIDVIRDRHSMLMLRGTQYSKLWEYCEEVKQTNVGSTMMMKHEAPLFPKCGSIPMTPSCELGSNK
ncbi:hypothetical protein L3X38_031727 [Prunus dulcis]|uniref:Uncharacterized protein n=1 Tax=Prunus dulcis TaxID=3755 RepID=A0AAD4VCQ2_PRUDU|nr:hypothetical protein L3X38_031727 [Prunus dulcis]